MSTQSDTTILYLKKLGLSEEEALIFLYLNKKGTTTALRISKDLHISRTKVYRILDTLIKNLLVDQVLGSRGFSFKTTDPANLKHLITKEKNRVIELELDLTNFVSYLNSISNIREDEERSVRYYKGVDGLKQVTWNSLKADKVIYIYEMAQSMSEFLDEDFSEEVRREIAKRKITVKQITNYKKIKAFTKVVKKVKYWEPRYIDPKWLKLSYEVLIYNDVVAMYTFKTNPVCIEIHDKNLSEMQKDLFKYMWKNAQKMNILNEFGEAEVA